MCQPRGKLQIAAIHEKRKINRLRKLNELIFHQNQSLNTCISNWFKVKIQRDILTTKYIHAKKSSILVLHGCSCIFLFVVC